MEDTERQGLKGKKVNIGITKAGKWSVINYLGEARPERYCRISSFLSLAKPCGLLEKAGKEGG